MELYRLKEVKYVDLISVDANTATLVADALTTIGALQVTGIPRFDYARKRALEDLPDCYAQRLQGVTSQNMPDGSLRLSTGAASIKGIPQPMPSSCGDASFRLRSLVEATTRQIFLALDLASPSSANPNPIMRPNYHTFSDIMLSGEHLEHLHAYIGDDQDTHGDLQPTLDYHTDAGLMIAMTTGYYHPSPPSDASGLYLRLHDGRRVKAAVEEDALIVLIGDGGARWLAPVLGRPLQAVTHALIADLPCGIKATRSWYGKMYLPPLDGVIFPQNISFAQHFALQAQHSSNLSTKTQPASHDLSSVLPSACGNTLFANYDLHSPRFRSVVSDACPKDTVWCWAHCMDTSQLPCGKDAVCWDHRGNVLKDPNMHCMGGDDDSTGGVYCAPKCLTPEQSSSNQSYGNNGFCIGRGTSMYMQGFESSILSGSGGHVECVNLLFPAWTLDGRVKFATACVGVFCFCLLVQYIASLRAAMSKPGSGWQGAVWTALFYGLHITCGYFAMLIAMTYSVELFAMICLGLTTGYALFILGKSSESHGDYEACRGDDADGSGGVVEIEMQSSAPSEHHCCSHDGIEDQL